MDQLPHKINTESATMEQSNRLDKILQQMDPSLLQGYKKFMHEVIIQGISYHDLTFDTLNRDLFGFNKEVFDVVCEKAISYYEMHAPERIKSYGNGTCPGNDVIVLL